MEIIRLTRISREGKAVRGTITGTAHVLPTLENAEFIIPGGKYELKMTWSPRFKKMMPLVDGVKGRSGIRIHTGTIPEHSKGCILMTPKGVFLLPVPACQPVSFQHRLLGRMPSDIAARDDRC